MATTKLSVKKDVQAEIERLEQKYSELLLCAKGNKPSFMVEHNFPDDAKFNDTKYSLGELTAIDIDELEDCITRIETELRILLRIVKRKL